MGFRRMFYFTLAFLFAFSLHSAQGQVEGLRVVYDDAGFLSVAAENADLQEALALIAEKAGISIKSPENFTKSITIQFDRVPLEEGLHRILKDVDHVLIFSPAVGNKEREIVSGVFVLSKEALPSGSRQTPRSAPVSSRTEEEREDEPVIEEAPASERETFEDDEEDPILVRYERQLDRLEEQMETVEEGSPQENAIMNRITNLRRQIEKRLEELEKEESQ